jgi:hypothetical protein
MEDQSIASVIASVPEGRYRSLLTIALRRLPEGWDYYRTADVELSGEKPARGYASAHRLTELEAPIDDPKIEGHHEQVWVVTLYSPWRDGFSDEAVLWIIAHEFGHVASGMACGSLMLGGRPHTRVSGHRDVYREILPAETAVGEKIADAIGRAWGFWSEEEQFDRDVAKLT